MKKSKLKPEKEKKDNSIGLTEVKNFVSQALKVLPRAKKIEQKQIKSGYKWITNGKTSKLVNPKSISRYLSEGWRLSNFIN